MSRWWWTIVTDLGDALMPTSYCYSREGPPVWVNSIDLRSSMNCCSSSAWRFSRWFYLPSGGNLSNFVWQKCPPKISHGLALAVLCAKGRNFEIATLLSAVLCKLNLFNNLPMIYPSYFHRCHSCPVRVKLFLPEVPTHHAFDRRKWIYWALMHLVCFGRQLEEFLELAANCLAHTILNCG